MAVKTIISKDSKSVDSKPFPKLMISSRSCNIIFMESEGRGVVVSSPLHPTEIGFRSLWKMGELVDYNKPLTLMNE